MINWHHIINKNCRSSKYSQQRLRMKRNSHSIQTRACMKSRKIYNTGKYWKNSLGRYEDSRWNRIRLLKQPDHPIQRVFQLLCRFYEKSWWLTHRETNSRILPSHTNSNSFTYQSENCKCFYCKFWGCFWVGRASPILVKSFGTKKIKNTIGIKK